MFICLFVVFIVNLQGELKLKIINFEFVKVKVIDNIEDFPQFEAQNVFQTVEWMRLFEQEKGTKVVLFAVYSDSTLLLLQPLTINRYYRRISCKFASYVVAWREPWRAENITDEEAINAFRLMTAEIEKYCKKRALYIEYRHFSENNIYASIFNSQLSTFNFQLPWYNIYRDFAAGEDVTKQMKRDKKRQLKQSIEAGVEVVLEPTQEQIVEWYELLKRLYRRIHRPLPSVNVFLRLNKSGIGRLFVVIYKGRVISGSAMLYYINGQQSTVNGFNPLRYVCGRSSRASLQTGGQYEGQRIMCDSQLFYDWYRASIDLRIEGVYPSVVSTWQALQLVADMGGGRFDFMGAGPQNREYGVRDFKLEFGGELTAEYRYRKYLF